MPKFEVDVHVDGDVRMVIEALDAEEAKGKAERAVDIAPFGVDPEAVKYEVMNFEVEGEVY